MFHTPMQHATTAAQVVIATNRKVDCPRCGGYGDNGEDEDGRPYACYCCGTSGRVDLGTAYEEYAIGAKERNDAAIVARAWEAEGIERAARRAAEQAAWSENSCDDEIPW